VIPAVDEGDDVGGADPGMLSMDVEVDELRGAGMAAKAASATGPGARRR
jgi:hypothetical protein